MSVKLTGEATDNLILSIIYNDYRLCYWSYREDQKKFLGKPIPEHWEDQFAFYSQTLDAFYRLTEYYGGSMGELQRIRDEIDYGDMIIQGMSQKD